MIFGYANGTDSTINISKFFNNDEKEVQEEVEVPEVGRRLAGVDEGEGEGEEENDINFFQFLAENITIDNNIFGDLPLDLKIISIPEEILILRILRQDDNEDLVPLENNSYIYFDESFLFKQNLNLTKTSQHYYIDYQYFIGEIDSNSNEPSKVFYGRINRLKFKLCHDYCETCLELGTSDNDQKCLSCLPQYQYNYWHYNNLSNYSQENCVPEEYYFDNETSSILLCNTTDYKFYINKTNNKKICFKEEYDCPSDYSTYNETLKECFYCDIKRYKKGDCPLEELKESEIETTSNLIKETSELNIITTNELNVNKDSCIPCNYDCYTQGKCSFGNNETYEDIYETIKSNFISSYNGQEGFLRVGGGNNFNFQLTTIDNELNALKGNVQTNFSVIDLKDCADLLKSQYSLDNDTDLVILKYENSDSVSNGNEKSVQYEVYLPNSDIKLNLSVCSNTNIDIYVSVQLDEETQTLYDNLKAQGYDLFDKNNKFYKDICTPYKSENGTDVLLADRYNDFFVPNQLECQANCEYSDYLPESHYLKCECNVVDEEKIETEEPEKLTMKSIGKSFYNVLKYSNYKVLICYKLVFRKVTIRENVGNILSNLYFIGFLIGLGIFCYRKIIYLKIELEKLFEKQDNDLINNADIVLFNKNKIFNTENNMNKIKVKEKINEENNKNTIYIKKVELNSLKENKRKKVM